MKQADEYTYDKNGNMTKDLNKNITDIQYNFLNLPRKVTFKDGSTITYTYDANGTKLRTVHKLGNITTTTDYCGNVIYENGVQKLLLTDAGYISVSDMKYHYYLQDHQGNNRVVASQTGQKEEVNHYYPFGGTFASADSSVQPYKYNGKELDTKKGLNWYDYGARRYDATTGRFTTVDRFAEKYSSMSPYQYGANNPVNNIDINGDSIITVLSTQIDGRKVDSRYYYGIDSNGNYGFLDSNGNLYSGEDKYAIALTSSLNQLQKGEVGKSLVSYLMESKNIVEVANSNNNGAYPNGKKINWSSSNTKGGINSEGKTNRPTFIGLGHEMAHIEDIWKGTYDNSEWTAGIRNAEKYATHIENQLRAEHSLPLRTYYNHSIQQTKLLIGKTRASLFYKKMVQLGNKLIPTTPFIY